MLTGATGFIGRRLLAQIDQHDVLILTRSPLMTPASSHRRQHSCDLRDIATWAPTVKAFKPGACIHLAWEGLPDYSPERCRSNASLAVQALATMLDSGASKVVVSGSCWEYGDASGQVAESTEPTQPGDFAAAKLTILNWLRQQCSASSTSYYWARIFFSYGLGQRANSLIPSARAAALAGRRLDVRHPNVVQDFVHVDDVAAALARLISDHVAAGVYNIGSGRPMRVSAVADLVAAHYGIPGSDSASDQDQGFWADTSKIVSATGWRSAISIKDGVRSMLHEMDGHA